jgi:acyl carrier protein
MSLPTGPAEARALVVSTLVDIAPDLDPGSLDPDARLQEDLDLDSMDFLNFLTALSDECGVEIPERDYPRLATVSACADYLLAQIPAP